MSTDLKLLSKELRESGTRLDEIPLTIFHLARKINKGNLILPTPSQNWTNQKKSEYIESIYLNYPLTWLYSQELHNGKFLLKRGVERALTILEYFNGTLELTGLKRLPVLQNYSLEEIRKTDAWLYDKFTERPITMYVSLSQIPIKENDEAVRRSLWK